jgi:hypothetical protein
MARDGAIEAFKILEEHIKVNTTEVYCNVLGVTSKTTPLRVQDDLNLKTMYVSPDLYETELVDLIYRHSEFPSLPRRPTFDEFINEVSNYDKRMLLWGIYHATYETLGKHDISCPKCSEKWKDEIRCQDLIQLDDFAEKFEVKDSEGNNINFKDYLYSIELNFSKDLKVIFITSIPTIKQFLDALSFIDPEKVKENIKRFSSILSRVEDLTLITREIQVIKTTPEGITEVDSVYIPRQVYEFISRFVPLDKADEVFKSYNEKFKKYYPIFKKKYDCPKCGNDFDLNVDIEVALFRHFIGQ